MRRHVSALLVVVAAVVVLLGQISIAADNVASTGKEVYECNCGKDCKCGTVANQAGKCVCGIDMRKTGAYECNCGKGCKCGTVANQPGKCVCGIDMKKVN